MARVSYFQHFSQRENHVTNNTLLILRHFYRASPHKLGGVLSEIASDDFAIGLQFRQQIRVEQSVPDALITQEPLKLYIETKRGGELDKAQIARHIASISSEPSFRARRILIGLTRDALTEADQSELSALAKSADIGFTAVTFAQIVQSLRNSCADHEVELQEILGDYEEFLLSEKLLDLGDRMAVVPCGTSQTENVSFNLYYEPSHRPGKYNAKFLGLYSQKAVNYIGEIGTVVTGVFQHDTFVIDNIERGKPTESDVQRINKAIEACAYHPALKTDDHRFYLVDQFYETLIVKTSKHGLWGYRVFDLSTWLDYNDPTASYEAAEAADLLRGKAFT